MPPGRISVNEDRRNRPEAPIANIAGLQGWEFPLVRRCGYVSFVILRLDAYADDLVTFSPKKATPMCLCLLARPLCVCSCGSTEATSPVHTPAYLNTCRICESSFSAKISKDE